MPQYIPKLPTDSGSCPLAPQRKEHVDVEPGILKAKGSFDSYHVRYKEKGGMAVPGHGAQVWLCRDMCRDMEHNVTLDNDALLI